MRTEEGTPTASPRTLRQLCGLILQMGMGTRSGSLTWPSPAAGNGALGLLAPRSPCALVLAPQPAECFWHSLTDASQKSGFCPLGPSSLLLCTLQPGPLRMRKPV